MTGTGPRRRERPEGEVKLITFHLGDEVFGIDVLVVLEIIRFTKITPIPNSPDFVEGVMNFRGDVIPVVNLRRRIGMPVREADQKTRIIIVQLEALRVGFVVDAVEQIVSVSGEASQPPPTFVTGGVTEFVHRVIRLENALVLFLNVDQLLSHQEKQALVEGSG